MKYAEVIDFTDVRRVDPQNETFDAYERKAMLAMQTVAAMVDGDQERFDGLNVQLHEAASAIGAPPSATYEDLIFSNSVYGSVKVLTKQGLPATSEHEARFYRAHRIIETGLDLAVRKLMSHGDNAERVADISGLQVEPLRYTEYDVSPVEHVDVAVSGLKNLRAGLSNEETFNAFRLYYAEPLNGYAGPSGLYSATLPILDLIVAGGQNMPDKIRDFVAGSLEQGLYPQRVGYHGLLSHLLESDAPSMDMPGEERDGIVDALNRFRRAHSGAVRNLLPKVYRGEVPGSGGIENYQELIEAKLISKQLVND
jgi:hypothetical protein